jgi:biopolymer transport protein ExbD
MPCLAAHVQFWSARSTDPSKPPDHRQLACSELYQRATCGGAWQKELERASELARAAEIRPVEALPDPARIARDCAEAYCADLPRSLALCSGPPPGDNAALVTALRELDAAILERELRDARAAEILARKAMVFRVVTVPLDTAKPNEARAPDSGLPVITIELDAQGGIRLNDRTVAEGQFGAELAKLGPFQETRAVIRADTRAAHGRVIAVLDELKRAGVSKIAFGVEPAGSAAPTP